MMILKIRNHLLLAFFFFALTILQQYAFYAFKGFPIVWLNLEKLFLTYLFFLIFTFIKGPRTRLYILSGLILLNFFQMAHLSYFGTQILPNEIYLFAFELHEVMGVVNAELYHVLIPLIFTLIPFGLGYWAHRKIKVQFSFNTVTVLTLLYLLYNPARTYVTGNTWGRQPSTRELSGMNVYLSFSYFLGRILPHKLNQSRYSMAENESLKLKLEGPLSSDWDNIIIVLGESLSPHQMGLFGYQRPTTPFLNSLKNDPSFFHAIGISGGVSTDVSVAFFINMGYGDAGATKVAKGEHCLFKSAKRAGFSTHFLSIQSSQQLRYIAPYICSASMDDFRSLESVSPETEDSNAALDRDLLPKLNELLESGNKRFIMLHQRGSHGPWALRSTTESKIFQSSDVDARVNDYDNSVVEFDLFWRDLNKILASKSSKNLVIYLSDHGESVGQKGRWGHGFLGPMAFEVPILIQSFNRRLPDRTRELPPFLTHYNLALFTVQNMGWQPNQSPFTIMKDFVVYGNDIDGFAGKAQIKFGLNLPYEFKVIP